MVSFSSDLPKVEKGEMMKGLVAVVGLVLLMGVIAFAGELAIFGGAGPGDAALDEINSKITLFNAIIKNINGTPTVTGTVPLLPVLGSGFTYQAGERFWISNNASIGGKIEYFHTATSTAGKYTSDGTSSTIAISFDCSAIGFVLTGGFNFLNYGLTLGVHGGIGYYCSGFTSDITFEIPSGYPPISVHPHIGKGHYHSQSIGIEAGLSLFYPVTDWVGLGADLTYRALTAPSLTDVHGTGLDLDGDGTAERIDLSGISVQLTISVSLDLFQ